MWNPSTRDCAINQACKIDKYLDIKNCSCEKLLIGKSVIQCEDEVLNITETSIGDKKKNMQKKNCLPHRISLLIIRLLLLIVVSFGCYIYDTRDWIKKSTQYHISIKWII